MPQSTAPTQDIKPLSKLLSLLGLLATALYFTGWIYRWAYFKFFQIQLTSFNLSSESFFLAAFQVFFGHPLAIGKAIITIVIAIVIILIMLSLRQWLTTQFNRKVTLRGKFISLAPLNFLTGLADELIIVLVALATLFWLARWQANADAWQDAVNDTSSLPVVTVVFDEKSAALGRQLDDPFSNPDGLRLIGDSSLYNRLLGQELTDIEDPNQPRVWRLLLSTDSAMYIFPALPSKNRFLSIPVLVVPLSNSQLTLLSPRVSE